MAELPILASGKVKPKARKRFERPVANDLWQIDATRVQLAEGERVWVVDVLDDHAPLIAAVLARVPVEKSGVSAPRCGPGRDGLDPR